MHKQFFTIFIVFFLFIFTNLQAKEIDESELAQAQTVIENLHDKLIASMQAGTDWEYSQRYDFLEQVIANSFDFKKMSRLVLSRHWKTLSENEQKNFVELMQYLTTSTYATRFRQFENENFTIAGSENMKKQRVSVKTIIASTDNTHELNYVLHKPVENWLIISITANGINELAIKRSEYADILKSEGFAALVQQIEKQISRLQTQ